MVLQNAFAGLATDDNIDQLIQILASIRERTPFIDVATGAGRTNIVNTPNVSVSNTPNVGTVSTVTNQAQTGGLYTNADQYVQFQIAYQNIRNRITVT